MKCAQKVLLRDADTDRTNQASLEKLKEMIALLKPFESDE